MKLQVSSQLAVFAVMELYARRDEQLSVAEIASKYEVSPHHLAKVMNVLGRAGLVRSVRGAGGGYQFAGNARRTTLLDIIELFEHAGPAARDDDELAEKTGEGRALLQVMKEIDDIARSTLGSITIATMKRLVDQHGLPSTPATTAGAVHR
jgi:Rrf2 family protein